MGMVLDVISGSDIAVVVNLNIDGAIDLSQKGCGDFFDAIVKHVDKRKLSVLRIWSHGATYYNDKQQTPYNKGNIHLGTDQIDADTIGKYESDLKKLTPLLDTGARVELRGCQAALGTGAKMMLEMARIWSCEVQGSERSQPLLTWTPPVKSARPGVPTLSSATIVEYNDPRYKR